MKLHKVRILLDTGSSGSLIVNKLVKHLCTKHDTPTTWFMQGGNFCTTKKCKVQFILNEFFENELVEWTFHVDTNNGPHHYDMILGCDILSELRITIDFLDQSMMWDNSTVGMKDPNTLDDISSVINEFY